MTLEEALAEIARLREQLDVAQEFGRLGIWERDIPSGTGRWSKQVYGFFGLDPADGMPPLSRTQALIHPEDTVNATYAESSRTGGEHSARFRILRDDGTVRWIHSQWRVVDAAGGAASRAIGIMVDDTEAFELARSLGDASAQLRLAVDLGNIAIWRHDLRNQRMYYNDRAFAVLGLTPRTEGLTIEEVRSYIHPDDLPHVLESAQRALASDRPTDMEARYRRSDGSWRYVLTRRVVQRDASGQALAFVGVALDVTEQVEERRETAQLARRLETTAAAAGVGIWSVDLEADVREWNPQMFVLIGRDPAEGLPDRHQWWGRIVHPEDVLPMQRHQAESMRTEGELREHVFRIVRPDGQVRWLVDRAVCELRDGRRLLLGVTLDVTEQRRTELALREAHERAALAARGAGIGTWLQDITSGAATWDEQMWRLRGLEPRPGAPDAAERMALVHPADQQRMTRILQQRQSRPESVDSEFRVVWPDGAVHWLASRSVAVLDANGRMRQRLGVNWDITEARAAAAAREEKALAERASRAKSQFLARMSHELRTPLNAVLGFSQLLEREAGTPIGPAQLAKLGHIRRAGEHLLSLIDDVLDLTRLETGQLELDSAPLPLDALVADALPLVAPLAARAQVSLSTPATSALHAQADRRRLLQVLLNLLSNGVKYNRPGGRVDVRLEERDGRVWIEVADSGRGLGAEDLAHLFEPFNRLHAEREGIEGTGIGLVIVKALVERMGGVIEVHSELGVGTRFSVGLPAAEAAPAHHAPSPHFEPTAPGGLSGGRLLYIEDNPVNVALVEEIVRSCLPAIEFASAPTGLAGLEQARVLNPQLILLDMQLPDIDGAQVFARLREASATASIPCIAVSANAMPDDIERALALGFVDYWTKPLDVARFRAAIARRFSR